MQETAPAPSISPAETAGKSRPDKTPAALHCRREPPPHPAARGEGTLQSPPNTPATFVHPASEPDPSRSVHSKDSQSHTPGLSTAAPMQLQNADTGSSHS